MTTSECESARRSNLQPQLTFEQKQELVRMLNREVLTYRMWESSARKLGDYRQQEIADEIQRRKGFFERLF